MIFTGAKSSTVLAQASRLNFSTRLFNLLVTNIPGPQIPLYVLGRQLEDLFPLVPVNDTRPGPATRFKFADGAQGGLGFISSVSQAFCTTCNRVRLTAEGGLRTCLFSLQETPLRDLLRSGVSDDHLGRVIETAVWRKEEGHLINKPGFIKPAKSMSQIGG